MAYRAQVGRKPQVYVVPPSRMNDKVHNDLPDPTPAPVTEELACDREESGQLAAGGSGAPQAAGGHAKKGSTTMASNLTIKDLETNAELKKYYQAAVSFCRAEIRHIRQHLGGGELGPGPRMCVMSAGREQAWSMYLFEQASETGDVDKALKADRFAEKARQNVMAAREMAIKEAAGRFGKKRKGPVDPLEDFIDAEFEEVEAQEGVAGKEGGGEPES